MTETWTFRGETLPYFGDTPMWVFRGKDLAYFLTEGFCFSGGSPYVSVPAGTDLIISDTNYTMYCFQAGECIKASRAVYDGPQCWSTIFKPTESEIDDVIQDMKRAMYMKKEWKEKPLF